MRAPILGAFAIVLLATNAPAQTVEFRGGLCITSATAACNAIGWAVGDCLTMRIRPPNLGSNDNKTRIGLIGSGVALNYTRDGSLSHNAFLPVDGAHLGVFAFDFPAEMKMRSSVAPPNYIRMQGSIKRWDDTDGCDIDFRAAGAKKP